MEQPFAYKITVFTPTYNRAYILENLYRSLQRQAFADFEWLIVDDGSTDETAALVRHWQEERNLFPIRYFSQENGGKCRAINRGLREARGELFFTVDSDDYLVDDALEKVNRWAAEMPRLPKFCGFTGNMGTSPQETDNTLYPGGFLDGTSLDRYGSVDGERAFIFYTAVHRQYPYPEFTGETFLTEAVAWDRMAADGYHIRFHNPILTVYAFQPEGLTRKGYDVFLRNPQGTGLWLRQKAELLHYPLWTKVGMWYGFVCDAYPLLATEQVAQAIGMPELLVGPMWRFHKFSNFIRGKR